MTSPCPSTAELAAFLAGRLADGRAAEVRAHLADCEDCYEVVTEAAVFEEEEGAAGSAGGASAAPVAGAIALESKPVPGPAGAGKLLAHRTPRRGAPWVRWAAIAAALVVAAGSAAWWWQARRGGVDALYAAATDPRPGTVRLSGAPYQEPEPVLRGGAEETPRWKLLAAAERVREQAAADPSARNLHALGIANLLLGEGDAAVEQLERARRADPLDGRIASDLGAALIHRGLAADRPEDIAAGLDVLIAKADAAVTLDDRFNRALALDHLGRRAAAIAEWERYLELDRESAWAAEARERLEGARKDAAAEPL